MKNILFVTMASAAVVIAACRQQIVKPSATATALSASLTSTSTLQDSVQAIIDTYIAKGIPGIQVTVKTNDAFFVKSGGFAKTEDQTPFRPDEEEWIFSITKTFTASLLMKLKEKGMIDPDKPITSYLPKSITDSITGSDVITVRMLMNHTSGIINFTGMPKFLSSQINSPLSQPSIMQRLALVYNKPLNFKPGTDFSYSNTNYLLLQLIIEQASGLSYAKLLQKEIIQPLQLTQTFIDLDKQQLKSLWFPNYYVDLDANDVLENATAWNSALANASDGYGGIASTSKDVIRFYQALLRGDVVSKQSLKEMTTWVQGKESTQPDYGLGLEYFQFAEGTEPQLGHEGDGVGCSTQIMYVPATNTYLYINCTVGRQIPGPFLFKITDFKNALCAFVAKWRP